MKLSEEELELFELAFLLRMPLYALLDMPYDEYLGWCAFFKKRPPSRHEDFRAFAIMRTFGYKGSPDSVFPSLAPEKKQNSFENSAVFALLKGAKGGDVLSFKVTDD